MTILVFFLEVLEDKMVIFGTDLYDGLIKDTPNAQRFIPNGPSAITNKDIILLAIRYMLRLQMRVQTPIPTFNKKWNIYL